VGVGVVKLATMQHLSDCDGIAIFRISTKNCPIWPKSYQHSMQFDLLPPSSKFRLTWMGGVQPSQRPQKLHIGCGSSPHSAIYCTSPSTHPMLPHDHAPRVPFPSPPSCKKTGGSNNAGVVVSQRLYLGGGPHLTVPSTFGLSDIYS
jgi:hypothetical protein